jgi:hypothetical protein
MVYKMALSSPASASPMNNQFFFPSAVGRMPDGVFDRVVVDLDAAVVEVNAEQGP